MTFRCEDLRDFGLVLVPPSSPDYDPLLADIQRRNEAQISRVLQGRISPERRPKSAILLNQSGKTIAALKLVWYYEDVDGNTWSGAYGIHFGTTYWNTILPGSKRYFAEHEMAGDNRDVRMPDPDELRSGIFHRHASVINSPPRPNLKSVTLSFDGAFFSNAEFAGPNRYGLWESVTAEARSKMEVAHAARRGRLSGALAKDILDGIGNITGPATTAPPPPRKPGPITAEAIAKITRAERQFRACEIEAQRHSLGDEQTVDWLAAQADAPWPDFRRLT
jgi:hypothetical protein